MEWDWLEFCPAAIWLHQTTLIGTLRPACHLCSHADSGGSPEALYARAIAIKSLLYSSGEGVHCAPV